MANRGCSKGPIPGSVDGRQFFLTGPMPKWEEPTIPPLGESFTEGIEKLLKAKPARER